MPGLVVERLHLRRRAQHVQIDRPLGLGREMRQARQPANSRFVGRAPCALLLGQQREQGQRAQSARAASEKLPPRLDQYCFILLDAS